jgi:hypothetical protein
MSRRIAALLVIIGSAARAASPHLANIDPPGVQCGTDAEVTITGDHLQDAQGLLIYTPGIQVLSMTPVDAGKAKAWLRVAPDSPLGEHEVRLWTASGISELMPLYVGQFPNIECSGSNHTVAHAQPVPLNCTVNGVIHDEEIDYYSVQARRGDRITAEVEGMRLGRDMFDPWAAILDATGRQLAANDDNALLVQDPLVSIVTPADGLYVVSVRESTWGGSPQSYYRMHIGTYPQPVAVYPPGGQVGQSLPVTFLGDIKGPIATRVQLPAMVEEPFSVSVSDHGLFAPFPLPMRISPFPNVLQRDPNYDLGHATPGPAAPVAFNGIVHNAHETDYYKFHATKGTTLDITVYARQLRSPIDTAIDLWDPQERHIAFNDDSNGPDSYLQYNVPADGDYFVSLRDQLFRGGPDYVYRIEVTPVLPDVSFTTPEIVRNSQERQTVVIPRGNRYATMLRVKRESFDGDFRLNLPGLPPGVTLVSGTMSGETIPVIFQAMPDAPVHATLTDVLAQPADPTEHVASGYAQTVELVHGAPNDFAYLKTNIDRLAVSVADEAPFRIDLTPPIVPVLQNGQSTLKVVATRKPGFTGPINVSMLYNPPGISSQSIVTIPTNQDSVDFPINASNDARAKTWEVAAIASADSGQGAVWVSSDFVPLQVSTPFLTGHLDRANTVQGDPVTITCHLDQNIAFDGTATMRLMGLPAKVTAPDVLVTSGDTEAVFNVTTDPTAPPGQHKDLFCEVTVQKSGVPLVADTANGGVLRIDPAPKKEVAAQ